MIYLRCECGKSEYWDGGIPPRDCQGCDECGTTYASSAEAHKQRAAHDWEPRYNSRTGKPDRRMCRHCHTTERVG